MAWLPIMVTVLNRRKKTKTSSVSKNPESNIDSMPELVFLSSLIAVIIVMVYVLLI